MNHAVNRCVYTTRLPLCDVRGKTESFALGGIFSEASEGKIGEIASRSFVKEHVDFVGRQEQETKQIIRLVSWWASQQSWSSAFTTPDTCPCSYHLSDHI